MDFSLSIGIDKYHNLTDTPFAENDAKAFHNAMTSVYNVKYSEILLREKATYSSIWAKLRDILSRVDENDRFFFFFAGHGENIKSIPHISSVDTIPTDSNTWINIIQIIEEIASAGCNRNILFIDACESTIKLGSRKNVSSFSVEQIEKNSEENFYSTVFSSTSHKGVADINTSTKHGIWSSFLLKALTGDDEKALNQQLWLTNNSLQNYLSIKVKEYCKTDPSITMQNSFSWGKTEGEYIIKKFQRKEITKYKTIPDESINRIAFTSDVKENIKALSGFIKGSHIVPKYNNSSAVNFVNRIADAEIKEHMESTSKNLRNLLGLKSRDFKVSYDGGSATFECPYFIYTYSVNIDSENLAKVIFTAELHPIDIEILVDNSKDLDSCFPQWFDYLIYSLKKKINIEDLITKIEDADEDVLQNYEYDYDSNKSYVSLYNKSLNREIIIYERKVEIKFQVTEQIPNMIDGLKELSNQLLLVSNEYKLLG